MKQFDDLIAEIIAFALNAIGSSSTRLKRALELTWKCD